MPLPNRRAVRGFSLMEMLAVLMLMGVLAMIGIPRMDRGTLMNVGANGDARRIALDLMQARRRAISTGDNHFVRFTLSAGKATSFMLYRRGSGGDTTVEASRVVPTGVTIIPSATDHEFTFEGTALAAYSIAVTGGSKSWTVSVVPVTGMVRVVQTP